MKERLNKLGSLKLGKELSKIEMKHVAAADVCYTVCTGGTYFGFCSPGYCAPAGHGSFVSCSSGCGTDA